VYNIDIVLYGSIAKALGGKHIAKTDLEVELGTTLGEVIEKLGVNPDEKGYVFINSVLCDVPGLDASCNQVLEDGDHVGIFSLVYMWPYQYRDGARMSEALKQALGESGAMHHTYSED
jgi:molybdopterin converting factor small subunit